MARLHVISPGYITRGDVQHVGSTVSLIEAGDSLVVVDPGMVSARSAIIDPIVSLGFGLEDVTDVVISHHHPDHTINIALFPNAAVHDRWAVYRGDIWDSSPAEGREVAPGVTLWETPGHTQQDVTTIVEDETVGIVAFTHLWWMSDGPAEDPYAPDPQLLHEGRRRVLDVASLIVPGHGPAFTPGEETPR